MKGHLKGTIENKHAKKDLQNMIGIVIGEAYVR